ncbi:MAG: hypothetical protein CMJ18_16190 [Phycisphaeraceae bacterium]|nr:hypothetical protein [Phycisphaeraceae bacterium]
MRLLPVLVLLLASAPVHADDEAAPSSILIRNVRVFDGEADDVGPGRHVLVTGNVIERVSADPIDAGDAQVIDGGGRVLIPGLIDAHVHVTVNMPISALKNADTMYVGARAARELRRMLMRGFTTVRDAAGPTFGLKRAVDEGLIDGPRIYPSGAAISQTSGHGDFRGWADRHRRWGGHPDRSEEMGAVTIADGVPEVLAAVREQLRLGASQIKLMAGGGVVSRHDPLDVSQYTTDELKAAVDAASDWGTYVTVHAYNSRSVRRAVNAGVACIEHGHLVDEHTMKLLADRGVFLSPQVVTFEVGLPGLDAHQMHRLEQARAGTDRMLRLAAKHGVTIVFGTDLLGDPKLQALQPKEFAARARWFKPVEILRQATSNAAKLMALTGPRNPYPKRLGVIAEGAYADMLIVRSNPLEDIRVLADPETNLMLIMKDGKVYRNELE